MRARRTWSLARSQSRERRVSEEVAARIQELIASRNFKFGDRLPSEHEITETLGVGRSAIREGLEYIAALNITMVRQGRAASMNEPQRLAILGRENLGSKERRERLRMATQARCVLDRTVVELATRVGEHSQRSGG